VNSNTPLQALVLPTIHLREPRFCAEILKHGGKIVALQAA